MLGDTNGQPSQKKTKNKKEAKKKEELVYYNKQKNPLVTIALLLQQDDPNAMRSKSIQTCAAGPFCLWSAPKLRRPEHSGKNCVLTCSKGN